MKHKPKVRPPSLRPRDERGEIDGDRRRVVAGIAVAGSGLLLAGCSNRPPTEHEVSQEIMCQGRLRDQSCVIKKGTLGQHDVEQCVEDAQHLMVCNPL